MSGITDSRHVCFCLSFGVRLEDVNTVVICKEILEMGMKEKELSDKGEHMLLSLRPSPEKIRKLPFQERMAILYERGEQHPSD